MSSNRKTHKAIAVSLELYQEVSAYVNLHKGEAEQIGGKMSISSLVAFLVRKGLDNLKHEVKE